MTIHKLEWLLVVVTLYVIKIMNRGWDIILIKYHAMLIIVFNYVS